MARVLIAVALIAIAAAVAIMLERRRPDPPAQTGWAIPEQLDRADFDGPDVPWLVAVFTSETCESCPHALTAARALASPHVVVQDVEAVARKDLHQRYGVDAVPMILLVDTDGVVRRSFVGPPTATDLWAAMAELREGEA